MLFTAAWYRVDTLGTETNLNEGYINRRKGIVFQFVECGLEVKEGRGKGERVKGRGGEGGGK